METRTFRVVALSDDDARALALALARSDRFDAVRVTDIRQGNFLDGTPRRSVEVDVWGEPTPETVLAAQWGDR
jgi:hypothetical protein